MKKFEEKTIATKHIFSGNIISVQVDDVELPDGNQSKRELVKHPGAVAVIALTEDKRMIFVEQYRKPLERSLVEIPAGKIEPNEAPNITARRELEEETRYTTKTLTHLTSFYTSPGFADEIIHLYFTDEIEELDEAVAGDEDEFVERIYLTLEEIDQYIQGKKIYDAKTMIAVQYVKMMGLGKDVE